VLTDPPQSALAKDGLISGTRHLSQADLLKRARQAAAALSSIGVQQGARVALLMRNDFAFIEASMAASLLGASTVPLNWHLIPTEIAYIIEDSRPSAWLVHADLLSPAVLDLASRLGIIVLRVATLLDPASLVPAESTNRDSAPEKGAEILEWDAWIATFEQWQGDPAPVSRPMFYTSGTTGKPKGVVRSAAVPPEAALASQRRSQAAFGLLNRSSGGAIRSVMTGPLYHSAPNAYALNLLRTGGLLVLQQRFDPAGLLELIERHHITHLHMVPTMFVRLLALPEAVRRAHDLSSLHFVAHGAAPCAPQVKHSMIQWWGPVIHEYYAMTETGIIATCDSVQWLKHPGTVGCAPEGVELQIADEHGQPVAPGTTGEICVRTGTTPHVGYHGAPDKTKALVRDGFLRTGDIGHLDSEGFLFISDRHSDMVISGGVNLYPAEVEAALLGLKGVKDAAVFGVPDDEMGEKLVAVVELLNGDLTSEELRDELSKELASFKIPRHFDFDCRIPREDSGKVRKKLLRQQWMSARGIGL
jgi:long-chain acyl-CoA synthetase